MGQDDLRTRTPVQPAGSQDPRGSAKEQIITARGTHVQGSAQYFPKNSLLLSLTGQQISHRNFQAAGNGANQNHAIKSALRCDKSWEAYSDHNLPIPASNPELTFSEQDMHFMQSVEDSGSCHATTLPMNISTYSTMPMTSTTTVLESPMVSTTASFQGLPVMSAPELKPQLVTQQNIQQQQDASYQTEPASLEDLMNDADDEAMPMDAMWSAATPAPQVNQCPTGTGGGDCAGKGSQAESGSGGQSTFVTGYSSQNFGPSMVAGGNGGGGLGGGSGGDDDPFNNNRPIQLQRDHYADGNVLVDSDTEDLLRIIEGDFEIVGTPGQAFIPTLQTSEIFSEIDNLSGGLATTPGDNMMGYYSKFDLSGGGLQPMEESSTTSNPVPATPPAPRPVPVTTTPVSVPASDSISNSFDMIKLMKKQKKVPVLSRPSDLNFQPPSPTGSYMSAPSPAPSTPYPIQVSTPQRQEVLPLQLPKKPQQQERAPSMPPPSPASPPTPVNVRPFDCRRYEENGKMYLEMLVRKDLPEADRRFTLTAFFHAAQFCMDLGETMRDPCDLKVSNHVCANICDFRFDSAQSKLVFSIPSDCKHVNQWLTERGAAASFLDRHAILQQVLNTMATIHNKNRDAALWGCFMVFVAPDLRVYMIPDIVPMLCKMQATFGDQHFNPRFEDSRAVFELYERLIPPTINQNSSWISPGVDQLLKSFSQLVHDPSSVFRMAEIARILGEKNMCKMEVDYVGLTINIFCVEHELVLTALSSIQSMIPDGATIMWVPSCLPVDIRDLATAMRPMRLGVTGVFFS